MFCGQILSSFVRVASYFVILWLDLISSFIKFYSAGLFASSLAKICFFITVPVAPPTIARQPDVGRRTRPPDFSFARAFVSSLGYFRDDVTGLALACVVASATFYLRDSAIFYFKVLALLAGEFLLVRSLSVLAVVVFSPKVSPVTSEVPTTSVYASGFYWDSIFFFPSIENSPGSFAYELSPTPLNNWTGLLLLVYMVYYYPLISPTIIGIHIMYQ